MIDLLDAFQVSYELLLRGCILILWLNGYLLIVLLIRHSILDCLPQSRIDTGRN